MLINPDWGPEAIGETEGGLDGERVRDRVRGRSVFESFGRVEVAGEDAGSVEDGWTDRNKEREKKKKLVLQNLTQETLLFSMNPFVSQWPSVFYILH